MRLLVSFLVLFLSYTPSEVLYVNSKYLCFFMLAIMSIFASSLYNSNLAITEAAWYLQYAFMFATLLRIKIYIRVIEFYCLAFSLYFLAFVAQGNTVYILETGRVSRNAIGYGLTLLCVLYYISLDQNKKIVRYSYIIPAIMSVVIVWSGSRSGILSFVILLIGDLLGRRDNRNYKKIFRIIAFVILIYVVYMYLSMKGFTDAYFSAFSTKSGLKLIEDTRFEIIREYARQSSENIFNIVLGTKLDSVPIIARLSGNPHNMFVRLHANFGIVFFMIICICSIRALIYLFKENIGMAFVFLALLARGFSDIVGFSGLYDPVVYYFIFYFCNKYSDNNIYQKK